MTLSLIEVLRGVCTIGTLIFRTVYLWVSKKWGTSCGVLIIRALLFRVLFGSPIFGNPHLW